MATRGPRIGGPPGSGVCGRASRLRQRGGALADERTVAGIDSVLQDRREHILASEPAALGLRRTKRGKQCARELVGVGRMAAGAQHDLHEQGHVRTDEPMQVRLSHGLFAALVLLHAQLEVCLTVARTRQEMGRSA